MSVTKQRRLKIIASILITVFATTVFVLYNLATEVAESDNKHDWPPLRDYVLLEEPMVTGKTKETTARDRNGEHNIHVYRRMDTGSDDMCVKLRTLKGPVPICIHSPKRDRVISSYVKVYGTWEEDLLNATGGAFMRHPKMEFLDIGCNIGVYTLFVSKLGHRVVAIDPLKDNLKLLSNSLDLARLGENVTLLWNAVSDVHNSVRVTVPEDNVGGAYISDLKDKIQVATDNNHSQIVEDHTIVQTIKLDDLIDLFKDNDLFIKMDIEGHEARAIKGAREFLQHVSVRYIQMEWVNTRFHDEGQTIIDILIPNGFLPYVDIDKDIFLDPDKYYTWPENVFWIKR